jgi:thiol-disulfide isomerase/thioredoxin
MSRHAATALFLLALACGRPPPEPVTPTPTAAHPPASQSGGSEALPFIHDDYPKALAEAKGKNRPLFVDAWAPWCHSCQSLRTFVLTDPMLRPLADDFVWLSVDTEKDTNAEWVTRHPHAALPTLWVIDPASDRAILKWAGTVTAEELRGLLMVAVADAHVTRDGSAAAPATAAFVRGNHALAAGDLETAEKEHRAALAAAAKDHPQRPRIVEALISDLASKKQHAACAELAAAEIPALPPGTSRASAIAFGIDCAHDAKRSAEEDRLIELALHDVNERGSPLLADDRSALYEKIVDGKKARGDAAGARALASDWATFLEGEAKRAPTKEARASLDPWLLAASLAVGDPARAIPALEQSERDFPDDYNPPARLGRAYLELKKLDEADREADRAIAHVYGPRAMRVYELSADIARARGDKPGERRALEEALERSSHAVLTDGQKSVRARLEKRLAKL